MSDIQHPDPRFPDRPDHSDFWRLSRAVRANDDRSDAGESVEAILTSLPVDPESLRYMIRGRIAHMRSKLGSELFAEPGVEAALAAMWVDAFTAGVSFERDKGVVE